MCVPTYLNRFKRPNGEVKFIYSEKATKFGETFTLLLSYVVPVKSKLKISQNFVAISEYVYELKITLQNDLVKAKIHCTVHTRFDN